MSVKTREDHHAVLLALDKRLHVSWRDHQALHNICGVAPMTRRNGKRCVVSMRRAVHVRLRLALYHWSRVAIRPDAASRSRYVQLRTHGHSHPRALRSVADCL